MPTVQNTKQINRKLQQLGFGDLQDPNLMAQMATCVRDHDHFRGILMHMPMPDRKDAYDCLSPKLRFKAKPLADYEAESKFLAEKNQLPQYDPKTLEAREWGSRNVIADPDESPMDESTKKIAARVEHAIGRELREPDATQQLTLICRQCTYEQRFRVKRRSSAYKLARQDGWQIYQHTALCRACKPKPAVH